MTNSRAKGGRGEREVVAILQAAGYPARRTADGRAQAGRGDVSGVPGIHVEVKRCERITLPAWIAQAEADAAEGTVPVVVWRSSRMPWRVDLALDDFLRLIAEEVNDR